MIRVSAFPRFRHDRVDDAKLEAVVRGQAETLGRLVCLGDLAIEAHRRVLWRDHLVDGVLQHQHAVGNSHRDSCLRAALAADHREGGHAQTQHRLGAARQCVPEAGFLGSEVGLRPRGIEERDQRQTELRRQLHRPARLAEAGGADVPGGIVIVGTILADQHDGLPSEQADARGHGGIIFSGTVAVDLYVGRRHPADKVGRGGTVLVPRELDLPPRLELGVVLAIGLGAANATELVIAHEEVQQETERRAQILAPNDGIDEAVPKMRPRGVRTLRQLLARPLAQRPQRGVAHERVRLGDDVVGEVRQARVGRSGRGVGENRDVRQAPVGELLMSGHETGQLHQGQ